MKKEELSVLFTICARAGSKGVKSKNVRMLLNYPLVYYTLSVYEEYIRTYGAQYRELALAVNTDSEELLEQCRKTRLEIHYMKRREGLGGDHAAKADVICDTLKQMEENTGKRYDVVLDLDLTSPLRTAADIEGCLSELLKYPEASVSYTVTGARRLPYFNMVKKTEEGHLELVIDSNYATRQEAPVCYDMNASIYAYRREHLLKTAEQDVFHGINVGWIMKDTAVLDIDSEEDYELMGILAAYFYRRYPELGRVQDNIKTILKEDS